MSVPIPFPDPARGDDAVRSWWLRDGVRAVLAALAVAVGTMALGVLAGLAWAAVAPRPVLVMTSPGAAALVNSETNAFIAAHTSPASTPRAMVPTATASAATTARTPSRSRQERTASSPRAGSGRGIGTDMVGSSVRDTPKNRRGSR